MDNNKKIKKKIEMGNKEQIISKVCIVFSTLLIVGVLFASVLNKSNVNVADVNKDRISDKSVMSEEVKPKVAEDNNDTKSENDTKNNEGKDDITKSNDENKTKSTSSSKAVSNVTSKPDISNPKKPVKSGEIIMDYSYNTTPVYSKTLNEYSSTHTGIDLKADNNENVKCILDGEVKRVYLDDKLGYTIVIDHGGDFYSIYSNLNKKMNVKKGHRVNKGDVIGSVGKSAAFEIADDYHLHFEIKNGKSYVNPNTLYK
ncbi:peptidoglycan DD-metalloendopeptidase family protein [Anaerofustis stercorihominis]|uniref:peptidoglycan DD-metalloendopeptidase family protein n=1 Tax=Anaerofustis stercorihominis TaxID=214853 RepID=UPI00214C4833|nr:M23 family metallopeptidase [Anaerofustis stercorihominis]